MTTKELIEILKNCPADAPLVVYDKYGNRHEAEAYAVAKANEEDYIRDKHNNFLAPGTIYVEVH